MVKFWRVGVGKIFYKKRLVEKFYSFYFGVVRINKVVVFILLYEREINIDSIMLVFL